MVGAHKITIVRELAARRSNGAGHLIDVVIRHPAPAGIETTTVGAEYAFGE